MFTKNSLVRNHPEAYVGFHDTLDTWIACTLTMAGSETNSAGEDKSGQIDRSPRNGEYSSVER